MDVQGKVALVTGASRGIGRALALALARAGASVALVARDRAALDALVREIGPERAEAVSADLTDLAQLHRAFDAAVARFGRVDVLVNDAGMAGASDFLDTAPDTIARTVDLNVRAVAVLTRLAAEPMAARRSGHIVNMTSLAGVGGMPGAATYAGTKAALRLFTASLRPELEPWGIHVTDVVLGVTDTEMRAEVEQSPRVRRLFARLAWLRIMPPTAVDDVTAAVMRAIRRDEDVVVLPGRTRILALPVPGLTRTLVRLLSRPVPGGGSQR